MAGADRLDRDQVALVGLAGQNRTVEGLEPLGIGDRYRKLAGDVERQVMPADGDGIGINQMAFVEDRHRRRRAAEIEAGHAQLGFVVDQRGEPRCVGRGDQRLDLQVAAMQHQLEIAHGQCFGTDHGDIDAQLVANHALGIADALLAIDRVTDR